MKCVICGEWVNPDDDVWCVGDEAMHHECCNIIEKGLIIHGIRFEESCSE